jgi:hypothetical protein
MLKNILKHMTYISLFIFSCKGQSQKIAIDPLPVFSEIDSFMTSTNHKVYTKMDYFLVSGDLNEKKLLRIALDSFSAKGKYLDSSQYDNYLLLFYKQSDELNRKSILELPLEKRYKIFVFNHNECRIGDYSYWDIKKFKTEPYVSMAKRYKE